MPTAPIGSAAETVELVPLGAVKAYRLGQAVEANTLAALAPAKIRALAGPAAETSGTVAVRPVKALPVTSAVERIVPGAVFTLPVITEGEFSEAVAADDRFPVASLRVDWTSQDYTGPAADLTATIRSLSIERSITGELPNEAGLVDGYASGSLTARLGGAADTAYRDDPDAAMTLAEELSPYRTDSPLYGRLLTPSPVVLDLGFLTERGPKLYRQITGVVRKLDLSESTREVVLDALDPSELIRELITLPTYAEFLTHAKRRPWAITVNTQWIVDYVLRRNGIYASPPLRADAFIACTGHGGLVSERGFNGAPISINTSTPPNAGFWTEDSHPWGMLGTPENSAGGTVGYQEFHGGTGDGNTVPMRFENGYGIAVSMWLHIGSYMGLGSTFENRIMQYRPTAYDEPRLFINGYGNGDIYVGVVDENAFIAATPRIPVGDAKRWRHLGVHWRWTSASVCQITVRMDGQTRVYNVTGAQVTVVETSVKEGYRRVQQTRMMLYRSWTNMQTWITPTVPTLAEWQQLENHVGEADIGRGVNELLYLPDVAAVDSWELLKTVIGAEYGVHGFSELGRYYFRSRSDSVTTDPEVELDVEQNLVDVAYSISSDSVRNVVGYSTKPRYHDGTLRTVVKAEDILQFTIPGGKVYVYELDWPWGAAGYQGGRLPYCSQDLGVWKDTVIHGWTYSSGANFTNPSNVQNVVMTYVQVDSRKARLIVDNSYGTATIRLATAADSQDPVGKPGDPAMRIAGWPIVDQPGHVASFRDEDSIARTLAPRVLALADTEWRQQSTALDSLCQQLLTALAVPVTVLADLPVRGDPRVQPGQVARLQFRDEGSAPVVGTIVKVKRDLDDKGLTDLVSVRPLPVQTLAPPGFGFYIDISHYQGERADPIDLARVKTLGYLGCVVKIGQGAGTTANGSTSYGATIDPFWTTFRNAARTQWPTTWAGYWYVGNTETPAAQAARCKAALDDLNTPIMLDWEDAGGEWSNLLAVLAAFRSAGLKVTMLYAGSGYSLAHGLANGDAGTGGLHVIRPRYWTNDTGHPRTLWDDMPDPTTFGLQAFGGLTPDATQYTQYGLVYPGMAIDVNAIPGGAVQLARMFAGQSLT